jgi:hypothetical protein
MAEVSMGRDPINSSSNQRDNLTKIRGIGSTKQQWLQDSLHIYTFQELANASAEAIASRLQDDGHPVPCSEIEGWIAQAQQFNSEILAERSEDPAEIKVEGSGTVPNEGSEVQIESSVSAAEEGEPPHALQPSDPLQQAVESPEILTPAIDTVAAEPLQSSELSAGAAAGNSFPASEEEEWRSLASFSVEFQTRQVEGQIEHRTIVRHVETDVVKVWSGIDGEQLQRWFLAQASKLNQAEFAAEQQLAKIPVVVEISQLRVFQRSQNGIPFIVNQMHQAFPSFIKMNEPFSLEVAFELAGLDRAGLDRTGVGQVTYSAQSYARDRLTGAITHLSDTEANISVKPGQSLYTVVLPESTLPQSGIYCLQVLLILQDIPATPGYFEVPMLQVV